MGDAPVPAPGKDELLIKTKAATICTSDLIDIRENPFHINLPVIMGHEGAGVIEAVGSGVTDFKPGDEVTAHPVMACGQCVSCKRGLPHLCDNMAHLGLNRGGVFAEYFVIRQDRVRKKPSGLSFPESTLMEPVCCCIEALERGNVREGVNVLIIGDGPFGVLTAMLAKSYRPARIILSGRHAFRLSKAAPLIDAVINEKDTGNVAEAILEASGGEGIDSAIVCVANADAIDAAISVLRSRGTLSLFAGPSGKTPVDLFKLQVKELNLCGSCNDMNYLDKAMELLNDPSLGLGRVITHHFPFERWSDAFWQANSGKDSGLKVSLKL